jgi:hypothetical protein
MARSASTARRWSVPGAAVLALAAVCAFVASSAGLHRAGFPLDDAWIHQTYARNLAVRGEWSFVPGAVSGGSTSPLWTGMLAVGHLLRIGPLPWAYLLGGAALAGTALLVGCTVRRRSQAPGVFALAAGLTVLVEWHLVWAAASGMEITLVALLVAGVMTVSASGLSPAWKGALAGLGVWVRPDALGLLLIPLATLLLGPSGGLTVRLRKVLLLLAAGAAVVLPYLAFNLATAGEIWPSTLFAKQAEYAIVRELPLTTRLGRIFGAPLVGAGVLLLPGVAVLVVQSVRRGEWIRLAPLGWAVAHLLLFTLRLPVSYQHGRYQMPVLPVLLVLGWEGIAAVAASARGWGRAGLRAWGIAVLAVASAFLVLGGRAYAQDVALIESEMVEAARWISAATEPGALVAAHDIGALGYFGGRSIVDLAGLADPEVIPILRDEAALASLLDRRQADYLMTFPSWYPQLTACAEPVYASGGEFSLTQGGERMTVYRWPAAGGRPQGCMLYSP